jgi:hypothetical protein
MVVQGGQWYEIGVLQGFLSEDKWEGLRESGLVIVSRSIKQLPFH